MLQEIHGGCVGKSTITRLVCKCYMFARRHHERRKNAFGGKDLKIDDKTHESDAN